MFVQSLSFQAVILWAFPLLFLTLVLKNILAECSVDAGYIRLWADRYDNTIIFSIGESIFREFTLTLPGAASSFSFWPAELASKKPFSKVLYGIVTVYTSTGELVSDCYTCLLINGLEITATMDSKTQVTLSFAWKNNPYLNGLNKKNLPQLLTPFSSYSERENSWQVTFPGIGHVLAASWKFRKCDLILQVSVEGPHPMPGLNGSTLGCRYGNKYYYIRKNSSTSVTILCFPATDLPPKNKSLLAASSSPITIVLTAVGLILSYGLNVILTKKMLKKRKTRLAKLKRARLL